MYNEIEKGSGNRWEEISAVHKTKHPAAYQPLYKGSTKGEQVSPWSAVQGTKEKTRNRQEVLEKSGVCDYNEKSCSNAAKSII